MKSEAEKDVDETYGTYKGMPPKDVENEIKKRKKARGKDVIGSGARYLGSVNPQNDAAAKIAGM